MKPVRYYEFQNLVFLVKNEPTNLAAVIIWFQRFNGEAKEKKYGSTPTTTVSSWREIEKKLQYQNRKLETEMSAVTRKFHQRRTWERSHPGLMMRRCNQEAPCLGD